VSLTAGAPLQSRQVFMAAPVEFKPDWGSPPEMESDWPELMPDLPPYLGWARYVGSENSYRCYPLAQRDGRLIFNSATGLQAIRLDNGEVLWNAGLGDGEIDVYGLRFLSSSAFYCSLSYSGRDPAALSLTDGSLLWHVPDRQLIAAGEAGAWVCQPTDESSGGGLFAPLKGLHLWLLDARTGEAVQSFLCGKVYGYPVQVNADASMCPVVTPEEILCCYSDGHSQRIPRARKGWEALPLAAGERLVVAEYVPNNDSIEPFPRDDSGGYTQAYLDSIKDPVTGKADGDVVVSCYNLPDGKQLWRKSWFDYFIRYTDIGNNGLQIDSGTLVYKSDYGPRILSLADGSMLLDGSDEEMQPEFGIAAELPGALVLGSRDGQGGYELLRLPGMERSKLEHPELFYQRPIVTDGYLCTLIQQQGGWNAEMPSNTALACVKLGPDLEPLPGEMKLLSVPEQFTALKTKFFASKDPLSDNALMREVVAGGMRALNQLLGSAKLEDSVHLNALALTAAYLGQMQGEGRYGYSSANLLLFHLRPRGGAAAPTLVRWLADGRMHEMHTRLAGLLADIGGPEAGVYLADRGADDLNYKVNLPALPLKLDPPVPCHSEWDLDDGKDEYQYYQWAEAKSSDGTRYVVFNHEGLVSSRDIYLGIDTGGDGSFDEILTTGLVDNCYTYNGLGGSRLVDPHGAMQLTLALPKLTIRHHEAVMEHDNERNWDMMTATKQIASIVELDVLRKDSDNDGLTDISEKLMLLDPQNADSDSDGLPDKADPAPNVDAAAMGMTERGVSRALKFLYHDKQNGVGSQDLSPLPLRATYFSIEGCGPVAFSLDGGYGICVKDQKQRNTLESIAPGNPLFEFAHVGVGGAPGPGVMMPVPDGLTVTVNYAGVGYAVELKLVSGEYYPVRCYMTWIS